MLAGLLAFLTAGSARGQSSMFGGVEAPVTQVAPRAATERPGDFIVYTPRPVLPGAIRACSFRHALCVHAAGGGRDGRGERIGAHDASRRRAAAEGEVLALLAAANRAWDIATGALDLPAPDAPIASPGSADRDEPAALDLYLVDGEPYATRTVLAMRDPIGTVDRASAFALVGRGGGPGCALDASAARVLARAILFRVAPATDETSAIAESAYIASLMVPCAPPLDEGRSEFQAHPERGLAETLAPPSESIVVDPVLAGRAPPAGLAPTPGETYAAGVSLFYDWLDDRFGAYPGATVRALWALTPTVTPEGSERWNHEPDGFDVLRTTFKNVLTTGSGLEDLWLEFAVARAFVPRYPVPFAWSIDWPVEPRTLLSGVGVAPTGAAYLAIDCANRPKGARLRFEASWEEHARMRWALVRIDAAGREMGRVGVSGPDCGTSAQTTLVDLDGAARVLVVGSNGGDALTAFDPDDYRWEPHGWTVSLAGE